MTNCPMPLLSASADDRSNLVHAATGFAQAKAMLIDQLRRRATDKVMLEDAMRGRQRVLERAVADEKAHQKQVAQLEDHISQRDAEIEKLKNELMSKDKALLTSEAQLKRTKDTIEGWKKALIAHDVTEAQVYH